MADTTFNVSPEVTKKCDHAIVDYVGMLWTAYGCPIEQHWLPRNPVIACDDKHALLTAISYSFYDHLPLRLTPDALWITLARGFALHINENAEKFRHRFVSHSGKKELILRRSDFFPGQDNPWPEAFASFTEQIDEHTGGLGKIVRANFSTTGPTEVAASNLMAMETFKSYFEYVLLAGCGIPQITLAGTEEDWNELRRQAKQFAEYGLETWINALDPILEQFCNAKRGNVDVDFWKSIFRFNSGSGPAVMTGWVNVLFPYFKDDQDKLYANPYLDDWKQRLEIDDQQDFAERRNAPQGIGMDAIPNCATSVPLTVYWGTQKNKMRLAGGLLVVTQDPETATVEPECGWVVLHETSDNSPPALSAEESQLLTEKLADKLFVDDGDRIIKRVGRLVRILTVDELAEVAWNEMVLRPAKHWKDALQLIPDSMAVECLDRWTKFLNSRYFQPRHGLDCPSMSQREMNHVLGPAYQSLVSHMKERCAETDNEDSKYTTSS